jgi:tetratricopeptide (TPR) repeat protein
LSDRAEGNFSAFGNLRGDRYTHRRLGNMILRPLFPSAVVALFAAGCAARPAPGVQAPPERIDVPRTIVTPTDAASLPELYERARARLIGGDPAGAATELDRIYALEPAGELAPEALHEAGLAHELAGDRGAALDRFERVAQGFPDHALGRDGLLRSIRLLTFLERWQRASAAADRLLTRYTDLGPIEQIVARGAKALFLVSLADVDQATFQIETARSIVEEHRLDASGKIPRDLAQLYFALGEARRLRGEKIRFDPMPADFAQTLEQRCQLLLDAQSAYSDAMRAYDAHWSAMAGYRVGELYQKLHADLMNIPPPMRADTEARRLLFEGAMRLRYSVLLDKGLAMMDHTLGMARRTGEQSQWVERARQAKQSLERARDSEQAALDRLPYNRAELRQALDDLAKKASGDR